MTLRTPLAATLLAIASACLLPPQTTLAQQARFFQGGGAQGAGYGQGSNFGQGQKPYLVQFVNQGNAPMQLWVTSPQRENLGLLRPGQNVEIDFNYGEVVEVYNAWTRQRVVAGRVLRSTTVLLGQPQGPVATRGTGTGGEVPPVQAEQPPRRIWPRVGQQGGGQPGGGNGGGNGASNGGVGNLQSEISSVIAILNQRRAQAGLPQLVQDPRLQQVATRKAQLMAQRSQGIDLSSVQHQLVINGQLVGISKWVRESGYRVFSGATDADYYGENVWGEGGSSVSLRGAGSRMINTFLGEGPGGGHYESVMKRDAQHIGVGLAVNAARQAIVGSVIVLREEP